MQLKIEFLGGASAIGASSCLVTVGDTRFLVDCGIRFEPGRPLPDLGRTADAKLDAIVVTHAHSDHTGSLAVAQRSHPGTPIFMTPETLELVRILQRDALKIMDAAERATELPLYREEDVQVMLDHVQPVPLGQSAQISPSVRVHFFPAGHILGAAMLFIETSDGTILFTGDFSVAGQLTVPNLRLPRLPVDILVTETTYGNRIHLDRRISEEKLVRRLASVLEEGGRILIPAFAIGRAQEILLMLKRAMRDRQMPQVPVYVDGMVRPVCDVYAKFSDSVSPMLRSEIRKGGHPFFNALIQPVQSNRRSQLPPSEACILVSSSGMLSGGPSQYYAEKLLGNEKDAIFITGYQDEESPGRKLLELANVRAEVSSGDDKGRIEVVAAEANQTVKSRRLALGEKTHEVRCQFEAFQLSAHADRREILGLVDHLRPRCVVLVHGDMDAKRGLQAELSQRVRDIVFADEIDSLTRVYPQRRQQIRTALDAQGRTQVRAAKEEERVDTNGTTEDRTPTDGRIGLNETRVEWPEAKTRLLQAAADKGLTQLQFLSREVGGRAQSRVQARERAGAMIQSPMFTSLSLQEAEKQAASWMLSRVCRRVPAEDVCKVESHQAVGRRKGELNELFQKAGCSLPEFESELCPEGHMARVTLRLGTLEILPKWSLASGQREAEFGAAALFLVALKERSKDWDPVAFLRRYITPTVRSDFAQPLLAEHPSTLLSQWEQKKLISRLETEVEQEGSPHAPHFFGRASVVFREEECIEVTVGGGRSKREAAKQLHTLLVEELRLRDPVAFG
jgi:Cft2 family RNA processing exonuclease